MQELLEKLKSLDPVLWKEYERCMRDCKLLIDPRIAPAILQACLQEAISGKDWTYKLYYNSTPVKFHPKYGASILPNLKSSGPCHNAESDSMVKSLLAAYIAACEAKT